MTTSSTHDAWEAPAEDGRLLLWPDPQTIIAQTLDNQRRLNTAHSVLIQNVPLPELRSAMRRWMGHDPGKPLVATGHQIELYHPGVWAKDVLIDELARKVQGVAVHFAVDTDAPKRLVLRWPGGSGPITDDPRLTSVPWAGLLRAPSPAHLRSLQDSIAAAAQNWGFQPMLGDFLSSMLRLRPKTESLAAILIEAVRELDSVLGLGHKAASASALWQAPAYLAFTHHILARADSFAREYNAVLGQYRAAERIRAPGRPWPDLRCDPHRCEVPFWLDNLRQAQRSRAVVLRDAQGWALEPAPEQRIVFNPGEEGWKAAEALGRFLADHELRLSPRAMTLTGFLRLLVVDQFAHGIGGGRYDRITDRVIERCFGLAAPAFSVITATLLFPSAVGQEPVDIRPLLIEGRRIRHAWDDPPKRQMAQRIASLPRGSTDRRRLFLEMHAMLRNQFAASGRMAQWEQRLRQAQEVQEMQRETFDRELFFAIQSEARLRQVILRYHQMLAGAN